MHRALYGIATAALLLTWLGRPATAAEPLSASDAAIQKDAEQARSCAEDLRLLEAFRPLKLTTAQIDQILPVIQSIQARWKTIDAEQQRTMAERKATLAEARTQALRGGPVSPVVHEQLRHFTYAAHKKQEGYRRDGVVLLSGRLSQILSPTQAQQIRDHTEAAMTGKATPFALPAVSVSTTASARSEPEQLADSLRDPEALSEEIKNWHDRLDKLRNASGAQVQIQRAKFADKLLKGLDPSAPEYTALLDKVMTSAQDIASMPADRFQQERAGLVDQLMQMRTVAEQRHKAQKLAEEVHKVKLQSATGLEFFVDEFLLSERAPALLHEMRARLASGS